MNNRVCLPSYLSHHVFNIVYVLSKHRRNAFDILDSRQYAIDFDQLLQSLKLRISVPINIFYKQDEKEENLKSFYKDGIECIWNALTPCELDDKHCAILPMLEWTSSSLWIFECLDKAKISPLTNLILLKLTTIMERALGDVFITIAGKKSCPSLLNELLRTVELVKVFGPGLVAVLQILIGHPASLNLRNVLWHGFPMAGEIPSQYLVKASITTKRYSPLGNGPQWSMCKVCQGSGGSLFILKGAGLAAVVTAA